MNSDQKALTRPFGFILCKISIIGVELLNEEFLKSVQSAGVLTISDWNNVELKEEFLGGLLLNCSMKLSRLGPLPIGAPIWKIRYLNVDGFETYKINEAVRVGVTLTIRF